MKIGNPSIQLGTRMRAQDPHW